jgi:peptide/nickel transport system substrate-binding protein
MTPQNIYPQYKADDYSSKPDNSDEANLTGVLAWRNAWEIPELTAETAAAKTELDLAKRKDMYLELQRKVQAGGPFIIMFQQTEQVASRNNHKGFVSGPSFDLVYYRLIEK